ncbi:hypothetical protein VmeM32_00051 [Vibrio phage vB_VmeM-32]|nr:hypothetical protein VmeM32_00051 [Vibrio phage vB_VmeM-32]
MNKLLETKIINLAKEIEKENTTFDYKTLDYVATNSEIANSVWYQLEVDERLLIMKFANTSNKRGLTNCIKAITTVLEK